MILFNIKTVNMKAKEFTITENVLASQGQRFLNVIIDSIYLYPYFECRNDCCFNRRTQITLLFQDGLKT
jgi:hypothetical protein